MEGRQGFFWRPSRTGKCAKEMKPQLRLAERAQLLKTARIKVAPIGFESRILGSEAQRLFHQVVGPDIDVALRARCEIESDAWKRR